MGCLCPSNDQEKNPISKLTALKSRVLTSISVNEIKISQAEKKLENLDAQIKQGENDLKQNQYSYSDAEKKNKAKKLFDLQKDRVREQKSLDSLKAYTETLKNTLSTIDSKIEELRNTQALHEGNEIMKELGTIDTSDALRQNIENVMRERQKEEENLRIMQNGNNAIMGEELGVQNEDDYLKNLLGGGTSAPPAH